MAAFQNLTGRVFGMLTVLCRAPNGASNNTHWWCKCACGSRKKKIDAWQITTGHTKSCGCLKAKRIGDRSRTHGMSRTPEYQLWCGIKDRCQNPNERQFKDYGGRGISLAPEFETFEGFLAYLVTLGPRPAGFSLDRIDNNGNYAPGNIQWASRLTQGRNTRRVRPITFNGETLLPGQWAERVGIAHETLRDRLLTGWSIEQALTAPKGARLRRLNFPNQATDAEKLKARALMKSAIASGRLIRKPCERCGNPRSEGHHPNYRKPLVVRWLCRKHHTALHLSFRLAYPQ